MRNKNLNQQHILYEAEDNGIFGLPAEIFMQSTRAVAAEGDLLLEAQRLVAKQYSYFMLPNERNEKIAFDDLCGEDVGDAVTLLILYFEPINPQKRVLLGTLRLAFGDTKKTPPLEAMGLIDVVDTVSGKSKWPHEDLCPEVGIDKVCEMGRFVILKEVRDNSNICVPLTSLLLETAYKNAIAKGAEFMFGIMPEYVYKYGLKCGTRLTPLNDDKKIVLSTTEEAIGIRDKYPIYWEQLNPSLYAIDMYSYST